ncbi:MAG: hypothetical protein C5B54_01305 [Acidobacteria bacterium]|nr:MAG: hypothetical protein C5B54_01305 [Acidobacteriota bacterium]
MSGGPSILTTAISHRSDRASHSLFLENSLLFTFAMHALGIVSMALLLLPGMPGGGTVDDSMRIHYIASHPWGWRIGWIPWQLTALSDLLLGIALIRTKWIPKIPAILTALVTLAAVIPDQVGQIAWITKGIELAQKDPAAYSNFEQRIFPWTAAWGATLYCFGALGWTWCFVAAKTWSRFLTLLSCVLWPLFFAVCLGPFFGMPSVIVAAGNGIGFFLLELWFILVAEEVFRRWRPETEYGRYSRWRHPKYSIYNSIANSHFLRAWGELLPTIAFRSDIRDVIYVNYIVDAERLQSLVPEGLELQRIGPHEEYALFTFLTYRHGNFGPRFLGPLRRLLPSPIQSNWRIHVVDPRNGHRGIYFVSTAISSTIHALSARLLSEGVSMHVLQKAEVNGTRVFLDPGSGTAPDCEAMLQPIDLPLDGPWSRCFDTWHDFLAYAVPQDRAMSTQAWRNRVTRQEIQLGIPLDICQPMTGKVFSRSATNIVGNAEPFCFRVPHVQFLFDREEYDRL